MQSHSSSIVSDTLMVNLFVDYGVRDISGWGLWKMCAIAKSNRKQQVNCPFLSRRQRGIWHHQRAGNCRLPAADVPAQHGHAGPVWLSGPLPAHPAVTQEEQVAAPRPGRYCGAVHVGPGEVSLASRLQHCRRIGETNSP